MSGPFIFSRRRFLQTAGGFSALSLAASMDKLGLASAAAAVGGYKALVCVFLFGGNDSSNMVMPITNYAQYLAARPVSTGINIPQASLLIDHAGQRGRRDLRAASGDAGAAEPLQRRKVRDPVQRRLAVRTDHARAVHLVQTRRHPGSRQPVLAQRPAAAVHVVDRQCHARRRSRVGAGRLAT